MKFKIAIMGIAVLVSGLYLHAATLLQADFSRPEDLKSWTVWSVREGKVTSLPDGSRGLKLYRDQRIERGMCGTLYKFDPEQVAGRRIRFSAEFKGTDIALAGQEWNGAKFMFQVSGGREELYSQGKMPTGTFDWEKVEFTVDVPHGAKKAELIIGFQDSCGTLYVRNLKVQSEDEMLDIAMVANMGLADEKADDGRGGWSDQGPERDGSGFDFKSKVFAGVPFTPVDPARNNGKAIITLKAAKFPDGAESISFPARSSGAKYLYLLHTGCWIPKEPQTIGSIELAGSGGLTQTFEVKSGTDVADWFPARACDNAAVGSAWRTRAGDAAAMYVSKFAIDSRIGDVRKVTLKSANGIPIWIVAAVTLSENEYQMPVKKEFVAHENETWRKLQRPENPVIVPGSALDRSLFFPLEKVGVHGRVIINPAGQLAFGDDPGRQVRFLSNCECYGSYLGLGGTMASQMGTKEDAMAYAKEMRANGYNMTRLHYLDHLLMQWQEKDAVFNPKELDKFDYLVYCLKENGVYINLDAMSSKDGYASYARNAPSELLKKGSFKFAIHFDEEVRRNWIEGVERLLTHVNPYTKTRLVDDPVLALVVGFNEQEFAFVNQYDGKLAESQWRKFLEKRYQSTDRLKAAWGKDAPAVNSFAEIPFFARSEVQAKTVKGEDIGRFMLDAESGTADFYRSELRRMGYRGPVSGYNLGKTWHYAALRESLDAVTMNSYHDYPSKEKQPGSRILQNSSIGNGGDVYRWAMMGRMIGKPFGVTEYASVFWNCYRYEQSFVNGAYASLQDFDILTAFAQAVNISPAQRMTPLLILHDPIARAEEFLTFFMYRRRDVASADSAVRIVGAVDDMYRNGNHSNGISTSQSKFSLVTRFSLEALLPGRKQYPFGERELVIESAGGSIVKTDEAGFASTVGSQDGAFNAEKIVMQLKERGLLPATNRTRPSADIYESSTGEIFMDVKKNFMSLVTPRLQGICGEAGSQFDCGNFRVDEMTVKGNLALVSVDSTRSLADASRMVLVIATDARNTGMVFEEQECRTLRVLGQDPTLIECGRFTVTLKSAKAASLKLHPLDIAGNRKGEIAPVKRAAGEVTYRIDTAKLPDGPSIYFELAAQ